VQVRKREIADGQETEEQTTDTTAQVEKAVIDKEGKAIDKEGKAKAATRRPSSNKASWLLATTKSGAVSS
jgi:hypothetical protein